MTHPALFMKPIERKRELYALAACVAGALFFLALLPRSQNLEQYVTTDEDLTLARSGNFADALVSGRWQRTYQIGHPEVTVMWVSALMLTPDWAREFAGSIRPEGGVAGFRGATDVPSFMAALAKARLGMAIVHSLLIAVSALLIWRLAGPLAGGASGILLALEPFLVAHGQLLRGDALVAELSLVTLLSATAYWRSGAGSWALLLSSAAFGLALITKTPGILILPVVLTLAWLSPRRWAILVWGGAAALVVVAFWPAMWVRPIETIDRVMDYTRLKGGSPMDSGSFLLGQASADPGFLFYPVAYLMRLSPVALAGLLALVCWRPMRSRPLVLGLLAATVVFGLAMTFAAKKADRYMIPLVPLTLALAGLGAAEGIRRGGTLGAIGVSAVGTTALAVSLIAVEPYPLAYYNPLLGGGQAASRALLVGWGEGLDQVAEYLNRQDEAAMRTAAVFYPDALDAQFVGTVVPLSSYDVADYAVLYVASSQRGLTPPVLEAALRDRAPELSVSINGIPYAQVYRLARPEFAGSLVLESVSLDDRAVDRGESVRISLRWRQTTSQLAGWRSRVQLLHQDSEERAESIGPWQSATVSSGSLIEERHVIRAPRRLGRYTVALALQNQADLATLPLTSRPPGLEPVPDQLVFQSLWVRVQ